ncbi:MAG TPA: hypothetical protein VHS55_01110 [Solirubrobacteraceae bacterium]|nr:hypothetical protein [Solirubrobacteraceae bacterium]
MTAVLAVAGCGSTPKPPLTRAQLTIKADSICRTVTAKLEAASKGESASTPRQLEHLTAKVSGFEQKALTELTALVPPATLEAEWKRFVNGAQTLAEDTAKVGEDVASKNTAAGKAAISQIGATQKQMVAIAKRNGFKDCEKVA